jgi:hypothetical protein
VTSQPTKRRRNQLRDKSERGLLYEKLLNWRTQEHATDPLRSVQPITWLCDDNSLELLSKTHPSNLKSVSDVIVILNETEEWAQGYGQKMFGVITEFARERQLAQEDRRVAKKSHISKPNDEIS